MENMKMKGIKWMMAAVLALFAGCLLAAPVKDSTILVKITADCSIKLKQRMQDNAALRKAGKAGQQNFVVSVGFDEPTPSEVYSKHGYILEKNMTGVLGYYSDADLNMLQNTINPKLVILYQQEQVEAYYLVVNYFSLYLNRKILLDYSDANGNYNITPNYFTAGGGGLFGNDIWGYFSNIDELSNDFRRITDDIADGIFTSTNRTILLSVGKFCGKNLMLLDYSTTFSVGCDYLANVALNNKNGTLMTDNAYSRIPAVLRSYLEDKASGTAPVSLTAYHVDGMIQAVTQSKNVAKILNLPTYALLKPVLDGFSNAEYGALNTEERIHILKVIAFGTPGQIRFNLGDGAEEIVLKVLRTVPKVEYTITGLFDEMYTTGVLPSLYNNLSDASLLGLVGENNFSAFVNELTRLFIVKYELLSSEKYKALVNEIKEDHTLYYGTHMEQGNPSSTFVTDYEEGAFTSVDMLPNGDIKTNDNCYIRSKFSNPAAYSPADEMLPMEARNRVFKPFEPILCVLYSKPSFGAFEDKIVGRPFLLPAITFKWMKQKAWTYAINASIGDVVKLAMNAAVVGSISAGATGWRLYMDLGMAAKMFADDVIRIPQINSAIRALPGGDEFLWYYQKCSMIVDFAYISPYAFKFFKGFAKGAYKLSKQGYQTVVAFTEKGWTRLKDFHAKIKERLGRSGVVVEELETVGGLNDLLRNNAFKTLYEGLENGTLVRKYSQHAVSSAEEASLKLYIQDHYYTELNKALAGEIAMTTEYAAMKSFILSAIGKLPKEFGITVFRGAGATESAFAKTLVKGQTFNFGGRITSSSTNESTADLFRRGRNGDIIWQIESKNGVSLNAINPGESEVIFKSNTQFELVDIIPSTTTPNVTIYKIREI
jgi:hypothetical protein